MDNVALSLSGEFGWRFDVSSLFYVEPQVEATYTFVDAERLELSDGSNYEFDDAHSLLGRAGHGPRHEVSEPTRATSMLAFRPSMSSWAT